MSRPRAAVMTDKEMVLKTNEWPRWPLLPMKRKDGNSFRNDFCGFLIGEKNERNAEWCTLYIGSIYRIDDKHPVTSFPTRTFESIDSLLSEYVID